MAKPTVAQLQTEIEALKRRVAELEGAKPKSETLEDQIAKMKRAFEESEKERLPNYLPPPRYYWPRWEPYWLSPSTPGYQWPPGTIIC